VLSFVVPAHDEEALIGGALDAIRSSADSAGSSYEIIVVDDGSTDRTVAIAAAAGARVVSVNVRQIGMARNAGAAVATGDTLVFVDADTFVTPAHVRGVVEAMKGGAVGGGSAARFDEPVPFYAQFMIRAMGPVFRVLRLAAGSFLFCSKAAFDAVGGFDPALYVSEEITLSRKLNRRGKFVVLREPVVTSGRKARTYSTREIARTWIRLLVKPRSVRDRSRLDLWYGPRRRDR
jgi:glycosyltransferase involved in cell wall biosynthesis